MNTKTILGYALGPLGSAAISAVSLPLISWYFSSDDIGRIVLLQTVSSLVLLTMSLGLDQAYIREYHASHDKAALFKSIAFLPPLLVFTMLALLLLRPEWPAQWVVGSDSNAVGLVCLLFLAGMLPARYLSIILRMQEKATAFSISQLAPKAWILVFVGIYVVLGSPKNTFTLVLAYALGQVLTMLILMWQTRHDLKQAWHAKMDMEVLKSSLHYGVPLAFGGLAYWGLTSIDRFLLKRLASFSELGIYSMAVSFGAVALIVQSVFSTIWAPMVFKWVKEGVDFKRINHIVDMMLDLIITVLCFVGIFSPIVPMILPEQYAPVQFILLSSILFPLFYTLTEVTGIGINVSKRTWLITIVSLIALVCNLVFLHALIPTLGAKGAAISSACAFWIYFVLKTECSIRLWQPMPRVKVYGTTFICLAVCVAYTYLGNSHNYFAFVLLWLATLMWLFIKHKNNLRKALVAIKGRLKRK